MCPAPEALSVQGYGPPPSVATSGSGSDDRPSGSGSSTQPPPDLLRRECTHCGVTAVCRAVRGGLLCPLCYQGLRLFEELSIQPQPEDRLAAIHLLRVLRAVLREFR